MRKVYKMFAVVGALFLGIILTGCGNSSSSSETLTKVTISEDSSSEESISEEISSEENSTAETEEDNSLSVSENAIEQTSDEENGIAVDSSEDDFMTAMDECAGVWPGSSGSSLREAAAAGMLLDWAETYGDLLSSDQIEEYTQDWIASNSDDNLEYLKEAWDGIVSTMQAMAADPDSYADTLGDAGYTLKYDSYDYEIAKAAIDVISEALQQ